MRVTEVPTAPIRESRFWSSSRASGFALLLIALMTWPMSGLAQFDHAHAAWTALLRKHVRFVDEGNASRLDYAGIQQERAALTAYRESLSRVSDSEFRAWMKDQQLAFLINAYNAHMIELILTRYPNIRSVWDFGKVFNNPFKQKFVRLFGHEMSLDDIEHGMIRADGAFADPRIHFAVNCASVGCPMLRDEAYAADRLDRQLDDQTLRFLSDRLRNRYAIDAKVLEVSKIFDWYGSDFRKGWKDVRSVEAFLAGFAAQLADRAEDQKAIREGRVRIRHLEYDWGLNDGR